MKRLHLGVVPEDVLDDEKQLIAWARAETKDRKLVPVEMVLSVTRTFKPDRTQLQTITICEALCDRRGKTYVTYHDSAEAR